MSSKIIYISILLLSMAANMAAQNTHQILEQVIWKGDTFYVASIEEVKIFPEKKFTSKRKYRQYSRLMRNVKAAYPYALIARVKFEELDQKLLDAKDEKEERKIIDGFEKELMGEYESELKGLTITQGRILIKLIDRELGNTSYSMVKELKGGISAVFWQTIARVFGSNLKSEYDPTGDDKDIEEIIQLIKAGQI